MRNQLPEPLPEPNPVTTGAHRRQRLAQIYLPVALIAIGVVTAAVFAARGSNPQVTHWGAVSAIVVVAPALFGCLVALAIFIGLIVLNARILKVLPRVTRLIQVRLDQISAALHAVADKMAAPVIGAKSLGAGIGAIFGRRR